ncbi:MAG: NAD(P)H-binding protein [Solirubrobacteraceae bacterium]
MTVAEPLRIALFGASGSIGSAIAAEALARGHVVVAVARDPGRVDRAALAAAADALAAPGAPAADRLGATTGPPAADRPGATGPSAADRPGATGDPDAAQRLSVVTGDATDAACVAAVAGDCDVVVSAVGGAAQGQPDIVVEAAHALVDGVRRAGHARLFVVGGAGSLQHPDGGRLHDQPDFPDAWKPSSHAQGRALEVYRQAGDAVDWTYLSPAHVIEPGQRTGRYRTGGDAAVFDAAGASRITIPDYAVAALDELEAPRFRGRRFTIGY